MYGGRKPKSWVVPNPGRLVGSYVQKRYIPNGKFNSTQLINDLKKIKAVTKKFTKSKNSLKSSSSSVRRGKSSYRGAPHSTSAGKLGVRRKSRKPKGWQSGKGVTMTLEQGGTASQSDIVYVGHITGPRVQVMYQAVGSMLKLLLTKMNIRVRELSAQMNEVKIFPGDVFSILYASDPSTTTINAFTFTVGATSTFDDCINSFVAAFAGTNLVSWSPRTFEYVPASSVSPQYASIAIESLMFHFNIKSSLKIQNRSVGETGDEQSDEVDNVPLYGKSIGGSGTGVIAKFPQTTTSPANVVGDVTSGVIRNINIDNNSKEPLSGYFFPKSSQEGKIHLDPGHIKTSTLTTRRNISLQYLVKLYYAASAVQAIVPFGKYRFFQVEKIMDAGGSVNLTVAFEHNLFMTCFATTKYNYTTAPVYKKIAAI